MINLHPANDTSLQQRLAALQIDLHSALAISNALLAGLTVPGPQMHHAIDLALDDALRVIASEDQEGSAAVHAIVLEVQERLRTKTGIQHRLVRNLERIVIRKISGQPSDGERCARDLSAAREVDGSTSV